MPIDDDDDLELDLEFDNEDGEELEGTKTDETMPGRTVKRRKKRVPTYYDDGRFRVTANSFTTPRKTYRMSRIEKVSVRRDPFFFALALSVLFWGLYWQFQDLLYPHEKNIIAWGSFIALAVTGNASILYIESKALAEPAAIAWNKTLRKLRRALDEVLEDREALRDEDY